MLWLSPITSSAQIQRYGPEKFQISILVLSCRVGTLSTRVLLIRFRLLSGRIVFTAKDVF